MSVKFSCRKNESTGDLLGLHFVELVDLFAHLGNGIVVLLAQVGEDRLVLDVGFLQIAAEFAQLSFALLVQLDLGGSGTAGFLQALAEFLKLAGQIGTLLLSLNSNSKVSAGQSNQIK